MRLNGYECYDEDDVGAALKGGRAAELQFRPREEPDKEKEFGGIDEDTDSM